MPFIRTQIIFIFALFSVFFPGFSSGQEHQITYIISDESRMWVEGKSTIGRYEIAVQEFHGQVTLSARTSSRNTVSLFEKVQAGNVTAETGALDAGGPLFNKHVKRTIRAEEYPDIRYEVLEIRVFNKDTTMWNRVEVRGLLEITGTQRKFDLECLGRVPEESGPEFRGNAEIDMTAFGLKPPVLFLGALRTNKMVTVKFHLFLVDRNKSN